MILVTVGTHNHGFNRLVQGMDELAAELDEQVIIQRGSSTYKPKHAEHFDFTTSRHMVELTQQARVIVMHAAAGAIITALREGKPLVVVPRLKQYNEHIDDHQQQLALALESGGYVAVVHEPSTSALRSALNQATQQRDKENQANKLANALRQQLSTWNLRVVQPNKVIEKQI